MPDGRRGRGFQPATAMPPPEAVGVMLASGALFPIGGRQVVVYARTGTGESACAVCQRPIGRSDIEYDVARGEDEPVACHLHCFTVWRAESLARPLQPS